MKESLQAKPRKTAPRRKTPKRSKPPPTFEAQLLGAVGHAIIAEDFYGNIIYWNKAAEALYGWRSEEVVGRNAREVGGPSFSEAEAREIIGLLRQGETWSGQLPLQRRDGSPFVGAVASAPLRNDLGELTGIATSITDITAHKDAGIASRQLSLSLGEAQRIAKLGSWEWNPETGEMRWSEQLFAIFEVPADVAPSFEVFRERVHPDDLPRVEEELRATLASGRTETGCDHRLLLPDGTVKMIEGRGRVVRDADGRLLRLIGTCLDITEAWIANEALRASEERFRSLVAVTAAVVWHTDALGREKEPTLKSNFTGIAVEEFTKPDGWIAAIHPDDRARAATAWRKAADGGVSYSCEYRLRRRDGAWRDMIARGVPVRNSDGTIREWIGTCVDVTELKATQEAVRFQAQLLDTTRESIIATDPAGKIIYLNRFAATQFRVDAEEAIGADIMDVTVPNTSREQAEEIMETLRRGETWSGEFIAGRRDGSKFPIHASNTPVYNESGELIAIVGVARDMSEYHESQRALRESEERYRATFDQAAVGVCQIRFDGSFTRVNSRLCELFGYTADELLHLKFSDITHPADLAHSLQLVGELSQEQRDSFAIDKRYVRKDGSVIWAFSTVSLMRDEDGKPQVFIAVVEDITVRKEAEEKLRFQAQMLDSVGEAVIATAPDASVIYMNRYAESLYGWSKEEAIGQNIVRLLMPEGPGRATAEEHLKSLRTGTKAGGEYVLRRRDGTTFHAVASATPMLSADGTVEAIIGVSNDVSEARRVGDRLLRSERQLRALTGRVQKSIEEERSRISREIHDELGQLLTGLKMDLRWVKNRLETAGDASLQPIVDRIVAGSELTDGVIRAVQSIAADLRPGVLDKLGLASALEFEARRFQERTGIACTVQHPAKMSPLSPDVTTALFRIAQESLTNAARHSGATLVEVLLEGIGDDGVHLRVTDNGRGMKEDDPVGEKALGLLGIRERVNLLEGKVSLGSSGGQGMTVDVVLSRNATIR
ncbi:MAG TPA: PAS domain S-box protein [Chthoniobacterales bacterium]|nr:PAS domain S-box protein [Chthoniobacterales bacterium]